MKRWRRISTAALMVFMALLFAGCSLTKHVPQGQYLLDEVKIHVTDSTGALSEQTLMPYVRQRPNNKFLHLSRLRLGVYNMSGEDSTKWWNKWIRRLGEAPVIYDPTAMANDSLQLLNAMRNAGFLNSTVTVDSVADARKKKIKL